LRLKMRTIMDSGRLTSILVEINLAILYAAIIINILI